jgi:undecaprenyl diphosphate synthase
MAFIERTGSMVALQRSRPACYEPATSSMSSPKPAAKPEKLPRHVGIIMDGNGRWAQSHGKPRLEGHRAGADSVRDITRASREMGIEALTLYAFSSQNWQRPVEEVAGLMQLLREFLIDERSEILDNQIRLDAIGDIERLPSTVKAPLDELRAASAHHTGMTLTLALSYGGRESIARAARAAARDVAAGKLTADDIDIDRLGSYLPTARLPAVDLLVRTSGEQRISNFMLWEIAYAELIFVDVQWPEFRREHLYQCLAEYAARERRFGLTSAQLASDVES